MKLRDLFQATVDGEAVIGPPVVVGVVVAVASLLVGLRRQAVSVDSELTSMAAFLFGVLLAFTIVRTRERLAGVQNLISKGNSALFSIYQIMAVFGEPDRRRIRDLIDDHLTDQITYRLVDYHRADASYLELTSAVCALTPDSRQEDSAYKELLAVVAAMGADRSLIEATSGQAMSAMEWTGLLLLLSLLLALITVLPDGSIFGALVAGVLAGSLVTLMVLLRKLDRLRWQERVTIWEPTSRLFRSMGRHPFVPREVIDSGRYCPTGLVRLVDYPDPYPIRSTKIITVVDMDGPNGSTPITDLTEPTAIVGASAKLGRRRSPPSKPPASFPPE